MKQDQIEQWINDWTKQNAEGNEQRVLRNFLLMDFAVQPNPKMQPCSNCDQQFMLFHVTADETGITWTPMTQTNTDSFANNCCTEVGQMLHPGRHVPPDQQATERQKALNQNPPGMTMAECELRALSGDRGYIPPTWYLFCHATQLGHTTRPRHHPSPLGHRDHAVGQVTTHRGRRRHRCLTVFSTRMATVDPPGVADQESTLPAGAPDTSLNNIQEPPGRHHRDSTESLHRGKPAWPCWTTRNSLPHKQEQIFGPWSHSNSNDWWKPSPSGRKSTSPTWSLATTMASWITSITKTAHLQDFLEVVLPNLHQHYICRSTECSFVIKASHWINSAATPTKQGKYLCPRCRTEYRPWAGTAVNNPNKRFCPAAQCLVTKVTAATPPDSDGWAQQLTNHTTSTDTYYLYLMKFPTVNDQELLNQCKLAVDQVAHALNQSPDPQAALMEYINTVLAHAQMLPYFQQHVVSQDTLNQVQQANTMRTKQPQWKWEHLPHSKDPNTGVKVYHYQGLQVWVWSWAHKDPWTCWCTSADCADLLQGLSHQVFCSCLSKPNAHECDTQSEASQHNHTFLIIKTDWFSRQDHGNFTIH